MDGRTRTGLDRSAVGFTSPGGFKEGRRGHGERRIGWIKLESNLHRRTGTMASGGGDAVTEKEEKEEERRKKGGGGCDGDTSEEG